MKSKVNKILLEGNYCLCSIDNTSPIKKFIPGQFLKIDKNFYAISAFSKNEISFFCKDMKYFTEEKEVDILSPLGDGFSHLEDDSLTLIAAGTGIGSIVSVVKYRVDRGMQTYLFKQTYLFFLAKDQLIDSIINFFPCLQHITVTLWDTTENGRPDVLNEIKKFNAEENFVLYSGPKELERVLFKSLGERLILNT